MARSACLLHVYLLQATILKEDISCDAAVKRFWGVTWVCCSPEAAGVIIPHECTCGRVRLSKHALGHAQSALMLDVSEHTLQLKRGYYVAHG